MIVYTGLPQAQAEGRLLLPFPPVNVNNKCDVCGCRIILHGKELEDKSRLSECGLDDEAPTVHLVMRLPAPGTARRKRDPVVEVKGGVGTPGGQMVKVKAEPDEDEELAAMNGAGIRQLSDMLLDGDQMEFDQVTFLSYAIVKPRFQFTVHFVNCS